MNLLGRFLLSMSAWILNIVLSVMVMIHGWGLEPKSYFWIIGVYLAGQMFTSALWGVSMAGENK